ncbi:MAG: hypothetical protein AAF514_05915, partial [Verrucomicrobiota bacterium]
LGISPGADTYMMKADFYLPDDTTMIDPDTLGVIARWVDEGETAKNEIGNNKAVSTYPLGEWFSIELSGTIPDSISNGDSVTHLRPIISFRDQGEDAGPMAVYVDNFSVTAETSGEDPNLNASQISPFSTYTDLNARLGSIRISNSGLNETLVITEAVVEGDDAEFYKVENDLPIEIPPGGAGQVDIRFTPGNGEAAYSATLTLKSNDSSDPELAIPLTALIIPSDAGSELIINGDFETGSIAGFSSNQPFRIISDPVHGGEFAAVYEFAGGLEWGSVNLDQPPPFSPEGGNTKHVRITEEMWEKEWFFSAWYSKPAENGIADDDQAQFIIRWNGVQPDAAPFTNIAGAAIEAGEWVEYTETGIVPTEWPPESGNPVTEAFLIFSFRDVNSDAQGGEQIYIDDWSFNIDGIELSPIPTRIVVTDVRFNQEDRSVTATWTSQPGETFSIETSTDLQNWTLLERAQPASEEGEMTSFTDTEPGADLVRYYRIAHADELPFLESGFEDGLGEWTVNLFQEGNETATTWEIGTPTGGPAEARSGTQVAGTDLDADYEAGTAVTLRSPVIDTAGSSRVFLSFWHYLNARAEEGGQVMLLEENGEPIAPAREPFIGGDEGNTDGWTPVSIRLPDLDRPFRVEFQFLTVPGGGDTGAGWFIDDVRVGKQ